MESEQNDHFDVLNEQSVFKTPFPSFSSSSLSNDTTNIHLPDFLTTQSPPSGYFIEVIKNGIIIEKKPITSARISFGRSRDCDFALDHPSISRFHAVILWSSSENFHTGKFYLVDLNSTHGTILNKEKMKQEKNNVELLPNNNIIRFGASSRYFMLTSVLENYHNIKIENESTEIEEQGCDWGFKDFEYEHFHEAQKNFSIVTKILTMLSNGISGPTKNDNVYSGNVQKTIQQWFDREGYDFEYHINYQDGQFKCSIDLPLEGQYIPVEGKFCTKKKNALNNVCLKICQLLDQAELLFPWQKQIDTNIVEESLESENELIDETESYKMKKEKKNALKVNAPPENNIQNFETLNVQWKEISNKLQKLKAKLASMNLALSYSKKNENKQQETELDSLDMFMKNINSNKELINSTLNNKINKSKLKFKISLMEKKQKRLENLIQIAKPNFEFSENKCSSNNFFFDSEKNKASFTMNKRVNIKHNQRVSEQSEIIEKAQENDKDVIKPHEHLIPNVNEKKKFKLKIPKKLCKTSIAPEFMDKETKQIKSNEKEIKTCEEQKFGLIIKKAKKTEIQTKINNKPNYMIEENYIEWIAPSDQKGDGKIALNEKLGY